MRFTVNDMTIGALVTALVTVVTMVIHIPVPATQGIINVGDTVILVGGIVLGRRLGLFAGGVGSALANILLGLTHWAPFTLVIKGLEGFLVGHLGHRAFVQTGQVSRRTVWACCMSVLWMVTGYFLAASLMYGIPVAVGAIVGDLVQAGASVILAILLLYALQRTPLPGLLQSRNEK